MVVWLFRFPGPYFRRIHFKADIIVCGLPHNMPKPEECYKIGAQAIEEADEYRNRDRMSFVPIAGPVIVPALWGRGDFGLVSGSDDRRGGRG